MKKLLTAAIALLAAQAALAGVKIEHWVSPSGARVYFVESRFIGRIGLYDESSTVELPAGMPKEAENALKRTRVRGVPINLRPDEGRPDAGGERTFKKRKFGDT